MKTKYIFLIWLFCLSGCSNSIEDMLGLNERVPDEFTVITYPKPQEPDDVTTLPAP